MKFRGKGLWVWGSGSGLRYHDGVVVCDLRLKCDRIALLVQRDRLPTRNRHGTVRPASSVVNNGYAHPTKLACSRFLSRQLHAAALCHAEFRNNGYDIGYTRNGCIL
eukprot:3452655-Rhodomonas_salina.1